ncbi:MAG TPA: DUF3237 domain-containing protein [Thermoanaerobaculia bacterium]|nr:DUF3237 domain-containing protein [Thermoanaerobaculia bacterium]
MNRRTFGKLWMSAAAAVAAPALTARAIAVGNDAGSGIPTSAETQATAAPAPVADDGQLRSEFLLELVIERGPANSVGSLGVSRIVVPVAGGTFEGPKLKGTIVAPSGDWIVARPDGSSVLDLRVVLQTEDSQKIYMTARGVAFTQPSGALYARNQPVFETGAAKYLWLNNVVAVGVYRPVPGKVTYRIYSVL